MQGISHCLCLVATARERYQRNLTSLELFVSENKVMLTFLTSTKGDLLL